MNDQEFHKAMDRLGKYLGTPLETDQEYEYFRRLSHLSASIFEQVIDFLIDTVTRRSFPLFADFKDAIDGLQAQSARSQPGEREELEFCQRCRNAGMYLSEDGQARFCDCIKGRKKEIIFRLWPAKKRIAEEQARVYNSAGPYRGLKEYNPLGFWEDTQFEHDRLVAAKRLEIEKIKRRAAEREAKAQASKRIVGTAPLRQVVVETLAQIAETEPLRQALEEKAQEARREPGEDDEIPF